MRAGNRIHSGVEVPSNAKIFKSKTGRECYLSGRFVEEKTGVEKASVKFLDNMEIVVVDWLLINKYVI